MSQVIVVGGGAAGMMAAYAAAVSGHQVVLLERNEKLGKKIYITGKGRCNVTNAAEKEQFFQNIISNSKFLYSSIYQFDNRAMMSFLEEYGCPVKTERGGRVFPVSDHASDVTGALQRALKEMYVEVRLKAEVRRLLFEEDRESAPTLKEQAAENQAVGNQTDGKIPERQPAAALRQKEKPEGKAGRRIRGVLLADGKKLEADAVILACGGLSYPSTGSDGTGFRLAVQAGHSVVPCVPALVPFEIKEGFCRRLQGLSLKNVEIKLFVERSREDDGSGAGQKLGKDDRPCAGQKPLYSGFGEMLFTHFGVSGPLILSASSYYSKALGEGEGSKSHGKAGGTSKSAGGPETGDDRRDEDVLFSNRNDACARILLNLKPAMDEETLDRRLLRDFEENSHKAFKNALGGLFPSKLIPVMVELSGINGEKKVYEITRKERLSFVKLIQNLPLTVTGTRGFAEAVITQGGIPVTEVNPSTMGSKICGGLYFAGEMLDIDALTGGYNLQLAWSTGHLAGAGIPF